MTSRTKMTALALGALSACATGELATASPALAADTNPELKITFPYDKDDATPAPATDDAVDVSAPDASAPVEDTDTAQPAPTTTLHPGDNGEQGMSVDSDKLITGFDVEPVEKIDPNHHVSLKVSIPHLEDEQGHDSLSTTYLVTVSRDKGDPQTWSMRTDEHGDAVFNHLDTQGVFKVTISDPKPNDESAETFAEMKVQLPLLGKDGRYVYDAAIVAKPQDDSSEPTTEQPSESTAPTTAAVSDNNSGGNDSKGSTTGDKGTGGTKSDTQAAPGSNSRESLPVTGVQLGLLIAGAAALIALGAYLLWPRKKDDAVA